MINAKAEQALLLKEKKFEVGRIIESTRNAYELTKSRESNLKQLLAKTKNEMLNINERFTQYTIMKRDVDMNRVLYDALTSGIKKPASPNKPRRLRYGLLKSRTPWSAVKTQQKRNLMLGLILGLFGGIGLAFY